MISNKKTGEINQRPVEDIDFVVLDHPQITFTQSVIQRLAANNAAVIFCDEKHHPASMLFHLDSHQTKTERKAAAGFRKKLLKDGFTMMQFSVYTRHCANRESARKTGERLYSCQWACQYSCRNR